MSANSRKTGNLVALGSAAVVAVYGAGFMRTAAAAERFAQQSNEQVMSPAEAEVIAALANGSTGFTAPVSPASTSNTPATETVASGAATAAAPKVVEKVDATTARSSASRAVVESNVAVAPVASKSGNTAEMATPRPTADARRNADSTATAPNAVTATAIASTAATPNTVNTPAPSANVPAPAAQPVNTPAPAPAVAAPVAPTPAATKADDAAPSAEAKPALKWKDGGYTGYGTSRHGDIEVYLETDGGKISYLKISQCLTQYSCSWISELPGQVIARQAPKVDAPSGATQSASAFYYAVVQALSKAK